jgi:hypothetical protein
MNWTRMLPASLTRIARVNPAILAQHWDGKGAEGKLNNAIQILKDAAQTGATIEQKLANSDAAQNAHPEIAATAAKLLPSASQ